VTDPPWSSVTPLDDGEQIQGFRCDRESVHNWLHERALGARPNVLTRLYLGEDERPVAFAATTMAIVTITGGSSAQRAGNREGQSVAFMLAQMGVRSDLMGVGVGRAVVRDVMAAAARAHAEGPFPLFVVDAADESLVGYYEGIGLRRLADGLRLATPMRSILRSLA
jgi:hypothetical protein